MQPNTAPRKPARWSDFDRYLKAEHLAGKPFTLTIARVEVEVTHPRPGVEATSPVLYFRETGKGLIVSPTNQDAITALFGDDVAACVGQKVTLKAISLKVAGRDTQPIRIYATTGEIASTSSPSAPTMAEAEAEEEKF